MKPVDLPLKSMNAVKAKDKEAWLALFEDDAVVEDPVGGFEPWDPTGEGQRGKDAISKFYDTFSASQSAGGFLRVNVAQLGEARIFTALAEAMAGP